MLKKILVLFAVVLVLLFGIITMQPSRFEVTRSVAIAAPPQAVYEQVNDFHRWDDWSPWAKKDPNAHFEFSGADAGEGAEFSWSGNDEVGEGKMTIVDSKPAELVRIRLDFKRPMECTNMADFTLEPEGEQTRLTWNMTGDKNFVMKAAGLFMDLDALIGADFEEGLANIKALAEKEPTTPADEAAPPADPPAAES